jgi:hypothetical protein
MLKAKTVYKKLQTRLKIILLIELVIASGILHTENFGPEKSIKDLNYETFAKVYSINTIGPALIGRILYSFNE